MWQISYFLFSAKTKAKGRNVNCTLHWSRLQICWSKSSTTSRCLYRSYSASNKVRLGSRILASRCSILLKVTTHLTSSLIRALRSSFTRTRLPSSLLNHAMQSWRPSSKIAHSTSHLWWYPRRRTTLWSQSLTRRRSRRHSHLSLITQPEPASWKS